MRPVPLRLPPGCDLRRELERAVAALPERAAFVVCGIGSLSVARLRYAGLDEPALLAEPLELLTLAGSLTPDGAHLHASVADAAGRVHGGHVGEGCVVRTTAEILLAALPGWQLGREDDPVSGYRELRVAPRPDGPAQSHPELTRGDRA